VDELIRQVPQGKVVTVNDLRQQLAKKHGVAIACPIVTGIGAWIAAHAAEEDAAEGKKRITPWWRVLKEGGKLNPKFPGGAEEQARRLKAEGVKTMVSRGGKTWRVEIPEPTPLVP
jgi:alkylated DNA nucleotide flippase Atl1